MKIFQKPVNTSTYTKREPIKVDAFLPVGYPVFASNNSTMNGHGNGSLKRDNSIKSLFKQ